MSDSAMNPIPSRMPPLATLIAIGSGLVSIGVMWGTLQYQAEEHERRIADMEINLKAAEGDTQRILNSLTELKTDVRYLREKLSEERNTK